MPRQLPWKSGGGGSRTQTIKPSTRQQKAIKIPDDIDDDFFDRTATTGDIKGKGKAKAASDSDDTIPQPASRNKRTGSINPKPRSRSSSPLPLAENAPPNESMRNGVSIFDLRDDEWMMVEDEFLETAKLFTRHLHIAEYDRLKETIEAKKKEAETARPVVAGAKRSMEGAMKERAKVQDSRQKRAIRDVFASLGDESKDESAERVISSRISPREKPLPAISASQDTDSDDLDVLQPGRHKHVIHAPELVSKAHLPTPPVFEAKSSFPKAALPAPAAPTKPRVRYARQTRFDMLDDEYIPPTSTSRPPLATTYREATRSQSMSTHSSPQTSQPAKIVRPRRSIDLLDDQRSSDHGGSGRSQEVADRIAKRKPERARDSDAEKKKRATRLDDIPTFLF